MKSPSLTFVLVSGIMVVSLMLVSPKPCWASSSTTTSLGMSIAGSNMELEFMMGSEFGRMLVSYSGISNAATRNRSPPGDCGRGQRYCLPDKNRKGGKRCAPYNRNCA